jgi:hypothetical protein
MKQCIYCDYLSEVSRSLKKAKELSNIEKHWILTEGFLRMHNEKDYCEIKRKNRSNK